MAIQLVVFDMAGTTVADDSAVQLHLFEALQYINVPPSMEDVNSLMGYPKPLAISMLLSKYLNRDVTIDDILTRNAHNRFLETLDRHYASTYDLCPTPGAEEIFDWLHSKGVKIALDTGFGRSTAEIIVERLGWLKNGSIDFLITSDDVEHGRPEPDMIYAAMNKFSIQSTEEVVKVGDTKSDMLQGTTAGCSFVVGVTSGAYLEEDLKIYPHTHLISHLNQLKDILPL